MPSKNDKHDSLNLNSVALLNNQFVNSMSIEPVIGQLKNNFTGQKNDGDGIIQEKEAVSGALDIRRNSALEPTEENSIFCNNMAFGGLVPHQEKSKSPHKDEVSNDVSGAENGTKEV